MLKQRAIKKILLTTLTMFIILTVYTIPTLKPQPKNILRTNLEIQDITNLKTNTIYLLNKENYLVQAEVIMEKEDLMEKIETIIEYLTINNKKIPSKLNGYIPQNTKLLNKSFIDNHLYLNFSKELLEENDKDRIITGIVYSLLEQEPIKKVSISVENQKLEQYQNLTKEIGINKEYSFSSRKDIQKVVVYYLDNSNTYYVPITKYIDDNREKIEIIVEELKKTHKDLISLENIHTKLIHYKEEENVFFLDFNEYLLDDNIVVQDKILNTIALSIFDNYDVNMVMFEVNQEKIKYISRK